MTTPYLASLNLPGKRECCHPLDHASADPFNLHLSEDGELGCSHRTVPESDAKWTTKRIDFLMELFKEGLWCLREHGVDGLKHPETVTPMHPLKAA